MHADLNFHSTSTLTVGVEVELQVLDGQTGDLAAGGSRIVRACADDGVPGVSGEFLQCMVEVKSDVAHDVAELRQNLLPRLRSVRNIAKSLGFELAMGATHPSAKHTMAAISPGVRYQKILERQGWMAYQEATYGLHVHVGVPRGDTAIGVINLCTEYLPHLLALSANSPFWQGVDTNCASARARMFRPTASAGIPIHFTDWHGYCEYFRTMESAGLIEGTKDIYWDIRPQGKFGTVEFRIFDVPSTLSLMFGLAALTRCLVAQRLRWLTDHPGLSAGEPSSFWLAGENKWYASRYGLEATCTRTPDGKRRTLAADLGQLISDLSNVAATLGESAYLSAVSPEQGFESGAERQRRIYHQTGNWHAVIDDLRTRWASEVDGEPPQ